MEEEAGAVFVGVDEDEGVVFVGDADEAGAGVVFVGVDVLLVTTGGLLLELLVVSISISVSVSSMSVSVSSMSVSVSSMSVAPPGGAHASVGFPSSSKPSWFPTARRFFVLTCSGDLVELESAETLASASEVQDPEERGARLPWGPARAVPRRKLALARNAGWKIILGWNGGLMLQGRVRSKASGRLLRVGGSVSSEQSIVSCGCNRQRSCFPLAAAFSSHLIVRARPATGPRCREMQGDLGAF